MSRLSKAACICAVGLMSLAPAATASKEPKPNNVAAKLCAAEKHADKAAFNATYGPKHAMRNCKRAHREEAGATLANAAQQCRAEQEADPALFAATYGTKKNAFGKCVSAKVKAAAAEEGEEFANAAQECRAERRTDPEAFQSTYGSNENRRNAFGKCVSQRVREGETDPPTV